MHGRPSCSATSIRPHEVRVTEPRRDPRLPQEARPELGLPREVSGEHLERDGPLEVLVVGGVDDGHPPAAELVVDAVLGDAAQPSPSVLAVLRVRLVRLVVGLVLRLRHLRRQERRRRPQVRWFAGRVVRRQRVDAGQQRLLQLRRHASLVDELDRASADRRDVPGLRAGPFARDRLRERDQLRGVVVSRASGWNRRSRRGPRRGRATGSASERPHLRSRGRAAPTAPMAARAP